ncbi:uncharacterized protein MELLADRAFT_117801 [Melampsora larici-populina 98AG31]|uniref:Uncharacterized protein n=1 Tax=Melampsora larici-populina (strain 98AG31 / pathotype 3-4-7) TaxID=747676 RepID=F4S1P3_MELLP|nr:uncharacterized protein MELLADRAFT_117801 [Melampsora larici-populina 98AG31]EGG01470.1 hypothetical protein MELLADRAFT_117801 [Melampsora larici-populina 98AG31]
MWASKPNQPTNLRPLQLVKKLSPDRLRVDVTLTPLSPASQPTSPHQSWRKEIKLTRVANRERKKLSTVTTSSSGSDSQASSKIPQTPCDLPVISGQLNLLEEKLETVENRITSRQTLFDNLEKDSTRLNIELQKELKTSSFSPNNPATEVQPTNDEITEDTSTKPPASTLGQVIVDGPSVASGAPDPTTQPAGWTGYFKLCYRRCRAQEESSEQPNRIIRLSEAGISPASDEDNIETLRSSSLSYVKQSPLL